MTETAAPKQAESDKAEAEDRALAEGMRKAQGGDAVAYAAVLTRCRPLLKAYLSGVLRRMGINDSQRVEDLVQTTLLAVHEKRHTYDPTQRFAPWLLTIARYKAIDWGRRRKTEGPPVDLEAVPQQLLAAPEEDATAASDLEQLLERLPERTRRILYDVKVEGLSMAEAAAREGMSVSAVKVTVHRALKTLKAKLGGES